VHERTALIRAQRPGLTIVPGDADAIDALIDRARRESDIKTRKRLYAELQELLAQDMPYVNLWYFDNVLVHSKRVHGITLNPSGNYNFLKTAEMQ